VHECISARDKEREGGGFEMAAVVVFGVSACEWRASVTYSSTFQRTTTSSPRALDLCWHTLYAVTLGTRVFGESCDGCSGRSGVVRNAKRGHPARSQVFD
jgi:hypothetical protein